MRYKAILKNLLSQSSSCFKTLTWNAIFSGFVCFLFFDKEIWNKYQSGLLDTQAWKNGQTGKLLARNFFDLEGNLFIYFR